MKKQIFIPQVICIVMLCWAINPNNPYAYYTILRWVCCGIFAYLAFQAFEQEKQGWVWVLGITALLYNPFFRVHLNRELWTIINVVTICVAVASIFVFKFKKEKNDKTKLKLQGNEPKESKSQEISNYEDSSYTKNSERKTFEWKSSYTVLGILIVSVAAFVLFVIFGPRQTEKPKTQEARLLLTEAEINGFKIIVSSKEIEIMAEGTCSKLTESKDFMTGKTVKTCYKYGWKKWVNNKYPITVGKLKSKIKKDSDVALPATQILVYPDKTKRLIFNGCRPHDCPDAEVFFLLDTTNKNMDIIWSVEGQTKYFGPNAELLRQNNIYAYLNEYK